MFFPRAEVIKKKLAGTGLDFSKDDRDIEKVGMIRFWFFQEAEKFRKSGRIWSCFFHQRKSKYISMCSEEFLLYIRR